MYNHFLFVRGLNKLSGYTSHFSILGKITTELNIARHKQIMNDIYPYLSSAYSTINNMRFCRKVRHFNNIIWFFWLQGPKSMPLIVKKCYESLKRNSQNCQVIFIDKNNVKQYAILPKYIYYKTIHGMITFTEFSDILRCNLLKVYGGIWCDSTNYLTSNINYKYFNNNKLLITSGCYKKYRQYISTKWTVSLMGGYKNNLLFIFMNNFFLLYWKYNNYLISYNLIDYALYFAYYHNIGDFKYYVDYKTPFNNPNMFALMKYMNLPFNDYIYNKMTKDTHIFKLTYKNKFIKNNNTFYCKLINNKL